MLINQSRAVHRYIILHLKFLQGIWWCPKSVCPWKISSFNVYTPCTHHTPCHTHVVWCHLRALIWLGGLGFSSVWFLFVSFDSSRFDTIRFDSIPFDPMLLVGFGFCSARSSTAFFSTFLLRSQAGRSFWVKSSLLRNEMRQSRPRFPHHLQPTHESQIRWEALSPSSFTWIFHAARCFANCCFVFFIHLNCFVLIDLFLDG